MSRYSRNYLNETFGTDIFKTFKETSKHYRFSLPHMDDINYENFNVRTCKFVLVKHIKNQNIVRTHTYLIVYSKKLFVYPKYAKFL